MKNSKIIFFTFLLFGCSDNSVVERWTDGTVKTKFFVEGNKECYEYYGETNQLIEEGCYLGKEKNGKWMTYHENGNVKTIMHYQHGVLGGEYIHYSKGGNILEKILYIDGFAEHKMKAFDNQSYKITDEDSALEKIISDKEGAKMHQEFYDNGTLKAVGKMEDFLKIGEWKYFHPNGTLWAKGKYLPQSLDDVIDLVREDLDLHIFPEEPFMKIGKWNFYNSQKELCYQATYIFKSNYTCRVKKVKH